MSEFDRDIEAPAQEIETPAREVETPTDEVKTPAQEVETPVEVVDTPIEESVSAAPDPWDRIEQAIDRKFQALEEKLAAAGTPAQVQEVRDEMDDLLKDEQFESSDDVSKVLARHVRTLGQRLSEQEREIEQLRNQNVSHNQKSTEHEFRMQYPDLDFKQVLGQARAEFDRRSKGVRDQRALATIWEMVSEASIRQARDKAAVKKATPPASGGGNDPVKTPPATVKPTSTNGTKAPPKKGGEFADRDMDDSLGAYANILRRV